MTDKELKKLSRGELLELLIAQTEQNERLSTELEQTNAKLQDKKIQIDKAGSLAEAALALNGIFDAAQAAAKQYLDNIEDMNNNQSAVCDRMKQEAEADAAKIRLEADAYSGQTKHEADGYSHQVRNEADAYSKQMRTEAEAYSSQVKQEADAYSSQVKQEADAYSQRVRTEAEAFAANEHQKADVYWNQVHEKALALLRDQETLREMIQSVGRTQDK